VQRDHAIDDLNNAAWQATLKDPREGIVIATEALNRSRESGYDWGSAEALVNLGWGHAYRSFFEEALSHFGRALSAFRSLGDAEGEMRCLDGLGVVHHNLSHLESALEYFNEELRLSQDSEFREREISALNSIGEVCRSMGRHAEALDYFLSAFALFPDADDGSRLRPVILSNLGASQRKLGRMEASEENLKHAYDLSQNANDTLTRITAASYLGLFYQDRKHYRQAELLHREALGEAERIGNRYLILESKQNLARLFARRKELDKALATYREALSLGQEIGATVRVYRIYRDIAGILEKKGSYRKALEYYRLFVDCRRSVVDEDTELKLEQLTIRNAADRAASQTELYRARNVELREKSAELEEANKRLSLITTMGQEITASLDLEKLMQTVYGHVNTLMDAAVLGIAIYAEEKQSVDFRFFIDSHQRMTPFEVPVSSDTSFGAWVIRNGREIVMNDVAAEFDAYISTTEATPSKDAASMVYLPLQVRGRTVGLLTVQSYQRFAYSDRNVETLRALASFIAIALENSLILEVLTETNDKILHMANHDNLTELPNRRLLSEFLEDYLPLARRKNERFAVLYIDLDDFKPINDDFGHGSGDEVLKVVAGRLRATLRQSDTVARVGGDEFVAVIRDVKSAESVEKTVRKVLDAVSRSITVGGEERRVSASIGVSRFPEDGASTDELIKNADEAMYRAKRESAQGFAFYTSPKPA
jgi:diguanylate cyclase (GGDEF)-like protein